MNDYIYYYLLAVNILAFVLFGADKQKARRNAWRIPEKTLILSAEYDSLKNEEIKILIPLIAIIETTAGLK